MKKILLPALGLLLTMTSLSSFSSVRAENLSSANAANTQELDFSAQIEELEKATEEGAQLHETLRSLKDQLEDAKDSAFFYGAGATIPISMTIGLGVIVKRYYGVSIAEVQSFMAGIIAVSVTIPMSGYLVYKMSVNLTEANELEERIDTALANIEQNMLTQRAMLNDLKQLVY